MFFLLPVKIKKEIFNKLVDIQIWIDNLLYQKIEFIFLRRKLKNNALNIWFKATFKQ